MSSENVNKEEKKSKSKALPIAMIIIVIALIIAILILFTKALGHNDENGSDNETTSAPTVTQPSDNPAEGGNAPSKGQGDTGNNIPNSESVAPTTGRGKPPSAPEHPSPNDPRFGPPDFLAKSAIYQIFSLDINPNSSYEKHFNKVAPNIATKERQKEGFIKWYTGDEHSSGWPKTQGNRLTSFVSNSGGKLVSRDTYVADLIVEQRLITSHPEGYSNLPDFKVKVEMKYQDGKWLINDWDYVDGTTPNIY